MQNEFSRAIDLKKRRNPLATAAIAGFGASGNAVLRHIVRKYIERQREESTTIPDIVAHIFEDRQHQHGVGSPYCYDQPVFRLNQPAIKMHLDDASPDAVIDWVQEWQSSHSLSEREEARSLIQCKRAEGLSENRIAYLYPDAFNLGMQWNRFSFLPRSFYGQFLVSEFKKTQALAVEFNRSAGRQAICITPRNARVTDIRRASNSNKLDLIGTPSGCSQENHLTSAAATVIATGHRKNKFLSECHDSPDYLDTPLSMCVVEEKIGYLPKEGNPVVIVGTSQSMLDALAALDAIDYRGKIIACSPGNIEPWPLDPVKDANPQKDYKLQYLTPANIQKILDECKGAVDHAAYEIRTLLMREMHSPDAIKRGASHALATYYDRQSQDQRLYKQVPDLWLRVQTMIQECSGNHTYGERFDLYQKYKREDRLCIQRGRIIGAVSRAGGGFDIEVYDSVTKKHGAIPARKIINAACMQTMPYVIDLEDEKPYALDPLTDRVLHSGLLEIDREKRTVAPAATYADGTLDIVGPGRGGTWGIPYFRKSFVDAAENAVEKIICSVTKAQNQLEVGTSRSYIV